MYNLYKSNINTVYGQQCSNSKVNKIRNVWNTDPMINHGDTWK